MPLVIKIVVNRSFGCFDLSAAAVAFLTERNSPLMASFQAGDIPFFTGEDSVTFRTHPDLIACVEALGSTVASGESAELRVMTCAVALEITAYDGKESVKGWVDINT